MKLTSEDKKDLAARGISEDTIEAQKAILIQGSTPLRLDRPATVGDGILALRETTHAEYLALYRQYCTKRRLLKFVPASGAASRMFEDLEKMILHFDKETTPQIEKEEYKNFLFFMENLTKLPCYYLLKKKMASLQKDLQQTVDEKNCQDIIRHLLYSPGLNFTQCPKALIPFHYYEGREVTALEEHLHEAMEYARDDENIARVHFTISAQHEEKIRSHVDELKARLEKNTQQLWVEYSEQKPSTDTIAITRENDLVRKDEDGKLLFRPGGHGALIENLQALDADIIFIKNIDNVAPAPKRATTSLYKKLLAGYLVSLQREAFAFLKQLEYDSSPDFLEKVQAFAEEKMNLHLPPEYETFSHEKKREGLHSLLNRPLRVCGMVKNEGEPGGGPFWVKDKDTLSLQIVEKSQIDLKSEEQKKIFAAATHFNPVDLVCSIYDYRGQKFDLKRFIDQGAVFISKKTYQGKDIQVLELPGLWNGAMAYWNTIFVEVPLITFNPVKKITDLLRKNHQLE